VGDLDWRRSFSVELLEKFGIGRVAYNDWDLFKWPG
jgi:hypothetical protein